MKITKRIAIVALAALVTACASPARIDQMTARTGGGVLVTTSPFKGQVAVKEVTGGADTNPMWTSQIASADFERALEKSLELAGLVAPRQGGLFYITADMVKIDQPLIGFNMTVTASVRYMVIERSSNKAVFDKVIEVPYTATMGDALMGVERLKLANEGAARVNIEKLIAELMALKLSSIAVN